MQTSLKRCGLKFSLRYDMSAKFPRGGGGGEQDIFFGSKSIGPNTNTHVGVIYRA